MTFSISLALSLSKSLLFSVFFLSISHSPRLDHNATLIHSLLLGPSRLVGSNPAPSKFPPKDNVAEIIIKHAKPLSLENPSNCNVECLRKMGVWKN